MKLTTHLQLETRLRIYGAIPPLPNTSSWCGTWLSTGTNLPFPYMNLIHNHDSQVFEYYHSFGEFNSMPYIMMLACIMVMVQEHTATKSSLQLFQDQQSY
jgi:hypothetical protein